MNDLKNFDYWHRVISYLFLYVFAGVVMMLLFQITIIIQYGSFHAIDANNFIQALLGGVRGSLKLFAVFILPFFFFRAFLLATTLAKSYSAIPPIFILHWFLSLYFKFYN